MPDISEAQQILAALRLPLAQQNEMAALTLIALCGLKPSDRWQGVRRRSMSISKGIMAFIRQEYGRAYAPNTRETFRRQVLHQFVQGRVADYNPDDPTLPTNSPKAHYAVSAAALEVIRAYGTPQWGDILEKFKANFESLEVRYQLGRQAVEIPLELPDGSVLTLSPCAHNQLQAQVILWFVPKFAPDALLLYLGDTADKDLYVAKDQLAALGIAFTEHDKLADIMLYAP